MLLITSDKIRKICEICEICEICGNNIAQLIFYQTE
jgi:hypothetical protein